MIRLLEARDYDELYRLWKRIPGLGLRSLDDSKEGIVRFLERNPDTSFAAEEDGHIIGAVLAGHDGRRGYIYHACVEEDFRRHKIARQLMNMVVDAMKKENITKLGLLCFKENETGNNFWKAMGYQLRKDLNYYTVSLNNRNQ